MKALIAVLRDPASARHFTPADWEALLGEGRRTRMLARVHHLLAQSVPDLPQPVGARDMLSGHAHYVAHMHVLVRNELRRIGAVAAQVDYPVILLKGAAYLAAQLPLAAGRGLSDIDVLVPRDALDDFERRLLRPAGNLILPCLPMMISIIGRGRTNCPPCATRIRHWNSMCTTT